MPAIIQKSEDQLLDMLARVLCRVIYSRSESDRDNKAMLKFHIQQKRTLFQKACEPLSDHVKVINRP